MRVSSASNGIWTETTLRRLGRDLAEAGRELSIGRRVDASRELGRGAIDIARVREEVTGLEQVRATNGLLRARLSVMQAALGDVADLAARTLGEAVTSAATDGRRLATNAASALDDLGRRLNSTHEGMHLFSAGAVHSTAFRGSGDLTTAPLRTVADAFVVHFGFEPNDPAAATVSGSQMQAFLDGPFQDVFEDAGWSAAWSGAAGPPVQARIGPGETVSIDVDARAPTIRQLTSGLASLATFAGSQLSSEARSVALADAVERIGSSNVGIASLRGDLGRVEGFVAAADTRNSAATSALEMAENLLAGVDPAQAAQRLNNVVQMLEASYAITRRLSETSLLKVL